MASETFAFEYTSSANIYFRLFNMAGQVFDFADNTFKALAGATTPYVAATERADMAGTGRSGYTAAVNLTNVNKTGAATRYVLKAYNNVTPADADNPVSGALDITVQFGKLGEREVVAQAQLNVKSTAGSTAQLAVWLEHGGQKVDIDTVDAACTASVVVREHGSGSNLFTKAFVAADLKNDAFEAEQASPNFTDDREYQVQASVTENGNTHTTHHAFVVIG